MPIREETIDQFDILYKTEEERIKALEQRVRSLTENHAVTAIALKILKTARDTLNRAASAARNGLRSNPVGYVRQPTDFCEYVFQFGKEIKLFECWRHDMIELGIEDSTKERLGEIIRLAVECAMKAGLSALTEYGEVIREVNSDYCVVLLIMRP